ncbi:MAG: CGNR zinc finger domain-containing protein [Candidatus Binataceae bacterium]
MDRDLEREKREKPLVRQGFRKYREAEALRRLQWLLGLIQIKTEEFQKHKKQERNLSDRLAIFAESAPEAFRPLRTTEIVKVVGEIRAGIEALQAGKPWTVTATLTGQIQPGRRTGAVAHYADDLAAAVLWSAYELVGAQSERIARCQAPECRTLFVRRKRGLYCSPQCSQRVRSAHYYEKHKDELNEARRRRYEKADKRDGAALYFERRRSTRKERGLEQ